MLHKATKFVIFSIFVTGIGHASQEKVACYGHVDGKQIQGEIQYSGDEATGTLDNGSKITVRTLNQCSTECVIQKTLTVDVLGTTLTSKGTYTYQGFIGDAVEGNVEYPLITGVINKQKFYVYCVTK